MAISAAGYVLVRMLGARFGLPIAGLASGFISSTATIGAMGARVRKVLVSSVAAVVGAALSTVATVIQLCPGAGSHQPGHAARAVHAADLRRHCRRRLRRRFLTIRALRERDAAEPQPGHAFSLPVALVFALTLSAVLIASAALREWFGETGVIVAARLPASSTPTPPRSRLLRWLRPER